MAGATIFRSHLTLRAYIFQKEERLLNCVDHLLKIECSRFSQGFLEHPMLLPDSCHDRDAIVTLTSRTEYNGEETTLVQGIKHRSGSKKVKENRQEFDMI